MRPVNLVPLSTLLLVFFSKCSSEETSTREKMKETVGNLMRIKEEDVLPPRTRATNRIAGYMRRLYEKAAGSDNMPAGTIRSIKPILDELDGRDVLFFPIGSFDEGDFIERADLHMMDLRAGLAAKLLLPSVVFTNNSGITLIPLKVKDLYISQNWIASVEEASVRWSSIKPLLQSLSTGANNLTVQIMRTDGRKPRRLTSFVRRHVPFLTIHTRNSEEEEEVAEHIRQRNGRRQRRSAPSDGYFNYGVVGRESPQEEGRSPLHSNGPTILNTNANKKKFTLQRYNRKKAKHPWFGFNEPEKEKGDMQRTGRILKVPILKVGGEEAEIELQAQSLDTTTAVNDKEETSLVLLDSVHSKPLVCGKRSLTVDFNEIGWGDWVISPHSFEADFCEGQCSFPLPKGARASNHALMQSVLSSAASSGVPAVCCAPDRMDSLTLLYFDQRRNVVLKNFPRMIVSSCGCL